MNFQGKGFLFSLLIHIAFVSSVLAIGNTCASMNKPLMIDLTLLDPVNGPPGPQGPTGGDGPKTECNQVSVAKIAVPDEIPKPEKLISKPKPVQKNREPKKIKKTQMPEPLPAVTSDGSVPIASQPSEATESSGAPPLEATLTGNDGAVSSGSGGSGGAGNGGQGGGIGGGGGSPDALKKYISEHFAYIRKIIAENIRYPERAKRMGWQGNVVASFVIHEDGNASDIKIATSSGFAVLDANVIDTVKAVTPFPKPPVEAMVRVPITYRLE